MAVYIDWGTSTIHIPRTDMLLLQSTPIEVRQLDISTFHVTLRDLEDDEEGQVFPETHNYKGPTEISGVILAQVMEILEPYTITFEDGQYAVNVVGGNSNIADRVNINNVGVRTANSAGLQDLTSLQAASFSEGSVAVKASSQYSGTIFPVGTRGYPVNNMADAKAIAIERGLNRIVIMESMTLNTGVDLSGGYDIIGDNITKVQVTVDPAADISNCTFRHMTISGTLDNYNTIIDCWVENLVHVNGLIMDSGISGDITISGGFFCGLFNCRSVNTNEADGFYPYITWDAQGTDLVIRDYSGDLGIGECLVDIDASYTFSAGRIHFEPECNNGTHVIRGDADVYDESGVNCTVVDETIHNETHIIKNMITAQTTAINDHTTTEVAGITVGGGTVDMTEINAALDAQTTTINSHTTTEVASVTASTDLTPVLDAITAQTTTINAHTDLAVLSVTFDDTAILSDIASQTTALQNYLDSVQSAITTNDNSNTASINNTISNLVVTGGDITIPTDAEGRVLATITDEDALHILRLTRDFA